MLLKWSTFRSHKVAENTIYLKFKLNCYELSEISFSMRTRQNYLTHFCNNTVKLLDILYFFMKSRKKTKNYFTKLHNLCYNNNYNLLF